LRAYSRLCHYRPQWRFSTWLFTIARRTSINYHRRPRPVVDHDLMRRAVSPAAGPEQLAIAAESRQVLWTAAARILGEEERTALWLHYVEGMPVGEIAVVLDRSCVAVKTMMFRARKKLLPLLGDLRPEGRNVRPPRAAEALQG
jgi:RNA polymerase sigma-70 factor (ECF subfamily)